MAILNFSDVLKNIGLEPARVKLIRHALSDERFRECCKIGMAHEYTQHQKEGFSKDYTYWITFVNAVYLIVDTKTGDRYVGSTYGYDGLLGRWSVYVSTCGHGNNKGIISHLRDERHSCHDLQFSVLQVLPKSLSDNQIIDAETLWKKKLLTYEPFGMNAN